MSCSDFFVVYGCYQTVVSKRQNDMTNWGKMPKLLILCKYIQLHIGKKTNVLGFRNGMILYFTDYGGPKRLKKNNSEIFGLNVADKAVPAVFKGSFTNYVYKRKGVVGSPKILNFCQHS